LIRSISTGSLTPSTPRSPVERAWGCRSAGLSSTFMAASYGRRRTNPAAPCSSSPCRERNGSSRPLLRRACRPESRATGSAAILCTECQSKRRAGCCALGGQHLLNRYHRGDRRLYRTSVWRECTEGGSHYRNRIRPIIRRFIDHEVPPDAR
jgi:hypothetical protein